MNYVSTRGRAPRLAFDEVLLAGLAADGGLYVPEEWPRFSPPDIRAMGSLAYGELAVRVMAPFATGAVAEDDLAAIIEDAYSGFDHPEIAPMKQLGAGEWLMELFHGPTLAFKDYALQFLGRMFDHLLKSRGERVTVIGATSGDTGSAAIEACKDRDCIEIFIMHPKGRVSEVQRRQMTTVKSPNVHNIAIEGTFDDCQALMKAMFNDQAFRDAHHLTTVNSINWGRIMAQIVYYFWAALKLGAPESEVAFAVPTGNFGNVYSGYAARAMGLPISKLAVGTNANDILTRFFASGEMKIAAVHPTLSPSMDIQISSNFERLVFELHGRDGNKVAELMAAFNSTGAFTVEADRLEAARAVFAGRSYDDEETKAAIRNVQRQSGELVDPHSAIAVAAGRDVLKGTPTPWVSLATAHPAKFPDAVEAATSVRPVLPPRLKGLLERRERYDILACDLAAVQDFVASSLSGRGL